MGASLHPVLQGVPTAGITLVGDGMEGVTRRLTMIYTVKTIITADKGHHVFNEWILAKFD